MDSFDPEQLKYPTTALELTPSNKQRAPRHRHGENFLRGPIPMAWLEQAAHCPGKALAVGLAIWFLSGMKKGTAKLQLTGTALRRFNVSRKAGYDGLRRLQDAGLVAVVRHAGRSPIVTLLSVPSDAAGHAMSNTDLPFHNPVTH